MHTLWPLATRGSPLPPNMAAATAAIFGTVSTAAHFGGSQDDASWNDNGKNQMPALFSPVLHERACLMALSSFVSSCSYLNAQNNPLAGDANISPKTSEHAVVLARQPWSSTPACHHTRAPREFQVTFSHMQTVNLEQKQGLGKGAIQLHQAAPFLSPW